MYLVEWDGVCIIFYGGGACGGERGVPLLREEREEDVMLDGICSSILSARMRCRGWGFLYGVEL